jgi:hypothetical protein
MFLHSKPWLKVHSLNYFFPRIELTPNSIGAAQNWRVEGALQA